MNHCTDNLRRILNPNSITAFDKEGVVTLEETDPRNNYTIELTGLPKHCLVIKTDRFKEKIELLNGNKGICKRADFVIINDDKIIFIELKSGRFEPNEIKQQFQGAQCVIDYCAAIGHRFFNDPNFLKPAIESCFFVLLLKTHNKKQPTRPISKEDYGQSPDKPKRIKCPESVYYRALTQ